MFAGSCVLKGKKERKSLRTVRTQALPVTPLISELFVTVRLQTQVLRLGAQHPLTHTTRSQPSNHRVLCGQPRVVVGWSAHQFWQPLHVRRTPGLRRQHRRQRPARERECTWEEGGSCMHAGTAGNAGEEGH